MSNLNHMICPTCGHDFCVSSAYATCDACQTVFYASQSRTSQRPQRAMPSNTGTAPAFNVTYVTYGAYEEPI